MGEIDNRAVSSAPRLGRHTIGLAGLTALVCSGLILCVWWTGAVPQVVFGHDVMVLLDGGWKWKWGFVPHTDYYSPFGALTFLLVAFGIDLSGSMAQALPAATCLVALFALPLAIYAAFTRLQPIAACAAVIVLIAAAVAPHELRFASEVFSYAAVYNRWAYALFGVGLLVVAVPPASGWRGTDWIDGAIAAACAALLIFLKISYGLLAAAIFVGFAPFRPRKLGYWAGAVLAVASVLLLFGILLRWGFPMLLADMKIASRARHGLGLAQLIEWARSLRPDLTAMTVLAGLWCLSGLVFACAGMFRRALDAVLLLGCFALAASAILMTNSPLGSLRESPITALGAVVFLSGILADCWSGAGTLRTSAPQLAMRAGSSAIAAALALLVVMPVTGRNIKSVMEAREFKAAGRSLTPLEIFGSGPLQDLQIVGFGGDPPLPTTYVGKVNDGLELLARTGNSARPVAALEFANPFNVARAVKPSRTAPTVWQLGFVFSETSAPALERVFDGEDVIMIPARFGDGNQDNLAVIRHHYGAYLDAHYVLAGESQQWQLLVPKRDLLPTQAAAPDGEEQNR